MALNPFVNVGSDFARFAPGTRTVVVRSIDPDTGATLATAAAVTGLKRPRKRQQGETVGSDQCRFILKADEVKGDDDAVFLLKTKDEITDADGVAWKVDVVEAIGFGQLFAADVTLKR